MSLFSALAVILYILLNSTINFNVPFVAVLNIERLIALMLSDMAKVLLISVIIAV